LLFLQLIGQRVSDGSAISTEVVQACHGAVILICRREVL
jgi:hypothetical protein